VTTHDVSEKEAELSRRKQDLTEATEKRSFLVDEIESIERKVSSIAALKQQFPISELRSQYDARLDLERNMMQMRHLLDTERTAIEGHKRSLRLLDEVPCGDTFPTCKFIKSSHDSKSSLPVHESTAANLVEKIDAMEKSLASLSKENLKEKIDKYNQVLEKERDLQVTLSSKQVEISRISSRESNLQSLVKDLDHELASMRLRVSDTDEAERASLAKRLVSELTRDINALDGERLNHAQMIGTLSTKLERTRAEREKHMKILTDWRIYDLFTTAVSKNGIPLKIMSIQLPAINAEISKILQGVCGFTVELEADPDSNEMEIYLNYGDSRRIIECGSGMEKMMASLAIRVALINTTSLPKSDLLIIDEGFGALDDMNVESCTRLLNSLKKWFKSILVISHVDAVKDSVDNVLDITQKDMNARVFHE
jgi:exonuclease SbcC